MIENLFLHFKTKDAFTAQLDNISPESIAYIQDSKEIYTHGEFYSCSVDLSVIDNKIKSYIVQELGQNTDKVPSQKLVEDTINTVTEMISGLTTVVEGEKGKLEALTSKVTEIEDVTIPGINELLVRTKDTVDNYTVNGHKISENPVLDKNDVGLGNVDNTSDLDKPISTATQEAISGVKASISEHTSNKSNPHQVTKAQVGLDKVDNTSDLEKPISTATQAALNEITSSLESHTSDESNPHNVTKEQVGLGNVTNDAQVKRSEMGVASGVATLDEEGKVPVSQLRGELAHVFGIEKAVSTKSALPEVDGVAEGDKYYVIDEKKIYTKTSDNWDEGATPKADTIYNFRKSDATGSEERTNIIYRWDGKDLVEISSSIALGETAGTAYEGSKGKANADLLASLGSKLITSVDAPTANAEKVTFNYKEITKSTNFDAEAPATVDIPAATKSSAGVMTAAQATELEQLRTDISESGNYTVNGHKISENPVLNGADIQLTGFSELPDETEGEQLKPAAEDTINQAVAKLFKSIADNEKVVSTMSSELKKNIGLGENFEYTKPEDITANNISGAVAEVNTKVNEVKSSFESTKSDYEAFKAQFEWYEGE